MTRQLIAVLMVAVGYGAIGVGAAMLSGAPGLIAWGAVLLVLGLSVDIGEERRRRG